MRILITDDEHLARAQLRKQLEPHGVEIVGEAENGLEALRLAEDLKPDAVFMDVQMPGLSGLQAAGAMQQMEPAPYVVFVTGHSEHAVAAFEQNAVDYLLKPASPDRVAATLARLRSRISVATRPPLSLPSDAAPLNRLPVRHDYSVQLVRMADIICAVAQEKRVVIRTSEGDHRTYYTLIQLEKLMPSEMFLRVHESCIVNLELVEELLFLGNHSYAIRLRGGGQLPVGRSRYPDLQRRLGLIGP